MTLVAHINEDFPNHDTLNNILDRVCNVMAFYELAIKVNDTVDSTDFYIILDEILLDTCKWVRLTMTLSMYQYMPQLL